MARLAQALWQLAHDLHAHEPLGQGGRAGSDVRGTSALAGRTHQDRSGFAGLHEHQGASGWHGGFKKNGPQSIGKSRGGWNTKIHMVAADARTAITFSLSPGQAHDAPEGRALLSRLGAPSRPLHLLMDRAYEGNETRQLALDLGFIPVVPPTKTRIQPWEYDRAMYKRRNEVERLFRRLKGYRRIFSRFDKLDLMFLGFISFVLVADGLRLC
jgi:transposase